jgi:hypothetical protein
VQLDHARFLENVAHARAAAANNGFSMPPTTSPTARVSPDANARATESGTKPSRSVATLTLGECPLLLCQGLIGICGFSVGAGHERGGADRDSLGGLERVSGCCGLVGEEQSPDAACEIALEAAERFATGLPVRALT